MDPAIFTISRSGEVLPITTPIRDFAFVPNSLPPADWRITADMTELLITAMERLGTLNGIGRTLPNPQLLLRPLQEREALQSSALEGTFASPEELMLFSKNPHEAKSERDSANASREVWNYRQALIRGIELLDELPLSLRVMREMHGILMSGVRGRDRTPGEFRTTQNAIGSNYRFVPPPPRFLDGLLADLERYINAPTDRLHPLIRSFLVHYQFEAIHPFNDGNGRIGRVVLALMVHRAFEHRHPWLYLSAYFERHKDEYIERLFRVSTRGEWSEWVSFCLQATIAQADDSIRRCDMLITLRAAYFSRVMGSASVRTNGIIERLFSNPSASIAELAAEYGVAYKTAKADIVLLEKAGILKKMRDQYPAVYYAWEIFLVAYSETPRLGDGQNW